MASVTFTDHLPLDFDDITLRDDVRAGLTADPKYLPPRWFYDKVGSELFEEITRLPEYYPTRTEREILVAHAADMVAAAAPDSLVELGSGSSAKTRLLLDPLTLIARDRGREPHYVALDVSDDALHGAATALAPDYPGLAVDLVRADFTTQLDRLPRPGHRLVAFLGSTIGNFTPTARTRFLDRLHAVLDPGEHFLLGTDLVKSTDVLVPAYDDAAGVTAAFNLNLLQVLNQRLGADLDRDDFEHHALWDARHEWIEMRLRARRAVRANLPGAGLSVTFAAGEEVRTEISAKFRQASITGELRQADFEPAGWWSDARDWFGVSLWRATGRRTGV